VPWSGDKIGTKTLLRTVVLRKALVDTRATGCKTQQLILYGYVKIIWVEY
jgi:hypothetical protein